MAGSAAHDTLAFRRAVARTRRVHNRLAFFALICGICAWVPLVILVAAPLAVLFALMAWVRGPRDHMGAAWAGVALTAMAVVLHTAAAILAGGIGLLGGWLAG